MREILFRGKTRTGEWVQGDYEHFEADGITYPMISVWGKFHKDVIRETVGQYTGLTDKNGKKIFEGDIVKIELLGGFEIGHITYSETGCRFKFADRYGSTYGFDDTCTFEVIGNIHDNPELLKGDKSDA